MPPIPRDSQIEIGNEGEDTATRSPLRDFVGTVVAVAGLALVVAVGGVVTLAALAWRRTRRRRDAADPRDRVLGAWAEALDRLDDAGIRRRPSATSTEFALRWAPAHGAGEAGPPLMALARLQTAALFAPEPPNDEDATRAWQHVAAIDHALRKMVARTVFWRHRLDPRRLREPDDGS